MIFQSSTITVKALDDGIAEFIFAGQGSINKFDQETMANFKNAITAIQQDKFIKGLMITSDKSSFIVGADINEFLTTFTLPVEELTAWIKTATDLFDALEDLPIPTLAAINGFALGGGCELILACDYRIADDNALIGLPEVTLGIMPGFGGSVRLPRIIGADNAIEWMSTGKSHDAKAAFSVGAVDAVVAPENLRAAALTTIKQAINGDLAWRVKRQPKLQALTLSPTETLMTFSTCKALVGAKAGKHYPSPMTMVKTVEACAGLNRTEAMLIENQAFAKLAKTDVAKAQTGLFLADQVIKSKVKAASKLVNKDIQQAAVLGAGIMGGGIAYQSAYKGVPIIMKDINQAALNLGLKTASGLLAKLHERGRLNTEKMLTVLNNIQPSLTYDSIKNVDIVVEAVVENPKIKGQVLSEVEQMLAQETILTSNTSTISIDLLAENLTRKDKFCGMHFFNPVHRMPLVEIIRGSETSDETVASVIAYAAKMGKSPIVVNDCPGFYVNRVLFPYFAGFSLLLLEGADFAAVDKIMEKEFGWPMGPAFLLDVVGIDTAEHCTNVMAAGFPTRMAKIANDPVSLLYQAGRYGQKNVGGFYNHSKDKAGKPTKEVSPEALDLLAVKQQKEFSQEQVIDRLMIPMVNEVIRCLEENIIATPEEADMALIYGLGFPPFRGGPIRYLETLGLANFIERADQYGHLGEIYQVTDGLREMAKTGKSYFAKQIHVA